MGEFTVWHLPQSQWKYKDLQVIRCLFCLHNSVKLLNHYLYTCYAKLYMHIHIQH